MLRSPAVPLPSGKATAACQLPMRSPGQARSTVSRAAPAASRAGHVRTERAAVRRHSSGARAPRSAGMVPAARAPVATRRVTGGSRAAKVVSRRLAGGRGVARSGVRDAAVGSATRQLRGAARKRRVHGVRAHRRHVAPRRGRRGCRGGAVPRMTPSQSTFVTSRPDTSRPGTSRAGCSA